MNTNCWNTKHFKGLCYIECIPAAQFLFMSLPWWFCDYDPMKSCDAVTKTWTNSFDLTWYVGHTCSLRKTELTWCWTVMLEEEGLNRTVSSDHNWSEIKWTHRLLMHPILFFPSFKPKQNYWKNSSHGTAARWHTSLITTLLRHNLSCLHLTSICGLDLLSRSCNRKRILCVWWN